MFVRNDNVKRCFCSFSFVLVVSHCALYPLRVRGKARVDARISGARASVTNRHDSTQHPLVTLLFVANHRAARVVLQRNGWGLVHVTSLCRKPNIHVVNILWWLFSPDKRRDLHSRSQHTSCRHWQEAWRHPPSWSTCHCTFRSQSPELARDAQHSKRCHLAGKYEIKMFSISIGKKGINTQTYFPLGDPTLQWRRPPQVVWLPL